MMDSTELRRQIAKKMFERIGGPTPQDPVEDNVIVVEEWREADVA